MRIYFAGAKPATKINWWDDPRAGAGMELNIMTTFFEIQKMSDKKQKEFMQTMTKYKGKNNHKKWKSIFERDSKLERKK